MTFKHKMTGMILAGGRGTRMGRVDKGLQPFRGGPLAAHVLQRLAPQVADVAINANRNHAAYASIAVAANSDAPVWQDDLQGFEGPLAGLQTGLRRCETDWLLTVPCDSPFVPDDLASRLAEALLRDDADLAVAVTMDADESGDAYRRVHPVFALMKKSVLPKLDAYMESGGRRMDGWYGAIKVTEVLFQDAGAFRNINTLTDLKDMEKLSEPAATGFDRKASLSAAEAQRIIRDAITPVTAVEKVALRQALERVLASDIISPIDVPAHDNSAMDGYAFSSADLLADGPTTLRVAATVLAGRPSGVHIPAGQCARIMTGGVMPDGLDTVLPQELAAAISADSVTIAPRSITPGANRRFKGEDLASGKPALHEGKIVTPADLGLLASLGLAEVPVRRRLRVAFFSTGDELRSIGETLEPGCIYDSNRYTLYGMLTRLGCDVIDMGAVRDDPAALEEALRTACTSADAVITSGGVSAGAADYIKSIMAELGDVGFWNLDMRPGRPMAFGRIASEGRQSWLFGLPGNPVAAMVAFYFFVRPGLMKMMGTTASHFTVRARSAVALRKKPGRTEYQRGIIYIAPNGEREVRITGSQGSGILRSMSEANCMVILPHEQGDVAAGELVEVVMFEGLI
ncbi:molybdopterin molybdotransferase MoeA [Pseudoduganella ginsengisoli]|nr:gephyrin-like molybdotransferase Glp [Pseudoduganella ginsengisoli]